MPQTATIKSLPAAFRMMRAMQADEVEWGEDYRGAARQALPSCSRAAWPRPSTGISSASPNVTRPTGATAATGAGC